MPFNLGLFWVSFLLIIKLTGRDRCARKNAAMTMMKMMANRGVLLVVLLVAWPAPLCCDAERVECVRAVPDDSGRIGRLVLRLRGGVGKHRGVQTENEFRKEDQVCVRRRTQSACAPCCVPVGLRYCFSGPEHFWDLTCA